jgi:transposase-like protein
MRMIRYSQGFRMQLVREVEEGKLSCEAVKRKYDIRGGETVRRWVRKYGCGKYGKVIRVEKANEVDEAGRLRRELRQMKEAVADLHVELAMEKAYLELACEQLNQAVEVFKKKGDGRQRTKRSRKSPSSK